MVRVSPQVAPPTLSDLLSADERIEVINGEVVRMAAASGRHHIVAGNIHRIIDAYTRVKGSGAVFFDGMHYLMYSSEAGLKDSFLPDTSFIRRDNIDRTWNIDRPYPGVPDLAVEVVSPTDAADFVQRKVRTYLDKGTEQVWLVYPKLKTVHQYIQDEATIRVYSGSQTLEVETLFPGLELTTDQIFALPEWLQDN